MEKTIAQLIEQERKIFDEISILIQSCKEGESAVKILVASGNPYMFQNIAYECHIIEAQRRIDEAKQHLNKDEKGL